MYLPLEGGWFMVGQGGGNSLLNYHHSHPRQRYAIDITALNKAGFRADGIYPADPARYAIFGAAVVAPCAGRVLAVEDGLPDLNPPERDVSHAAGNHIVLLCGDLRVEIAHLRRGSTSVKEGAELDIGDKLGTVGNSGNTSEPHLHIHAIHEETGAPVPLRFAGRNPVRNRSWR